jgi:hypothetical protein
MKFSLRLNLLSALIIIFILINNISLWSKSGKWGWEIIRSDKSELIIKYTPNVISFGETAINEDEKAFLPNIPGTIVKQDNPGSPAYLIAKQNISIPSPQGFNLESVEIKECTRYTNNSPKNYYSTEINSSKDNWIKQEDKNFFENNISANWVNLKYGGIARNRYIAELSIVASRYNPLNNSIEIPKSFIIRIKFNDSKSTNSRYKVTDNDFKI